MENIDYDSLVYYDEDDKTYTSANEIFMFNLNSNTITSYGFYSDYVKFIKELALIEYFKLFDKYPYVLKFLNDESLQRVEEYGCMFELYLDAIGNKEIEQAYDTISLSKDSYPLTYELLRNLVQITCNYNIIKHKKEFIDEHMKTVEGNVIKVGDVLYRVSSKKIIERFKVNSISIKDKIIFSGSMLDRAACAMIDLTSPEEKLYSLEESIKDAKTINKKIDDEIKHYKEKIEKLSKKKVKITK